jgi:hypothetical protein
MTRKNYTNAGARRAVKSIVGKLNRLHQDGKISAKQYISLSETMSRLHNRMK